MCLLYVFNSFKAFRTSINKFLVICIFSMSASIQNVSNSDCLQYRFLAVRFFAVRVYNSEGYCWQFRLFAVRFSCHYPSSIHKLIFIRIQPLSSKCANKTVCHSMSSSPHAAHTISLPKVLQQMG